jgi:hypothetical protein
LNDKQEIAQDYFDCSNLLRGVTLPGLSSDDSEEDAKSICVSEQTSSPSQKEDEEYFIDNNAEAQKMDERFFK